MDINPPSGNGFFSWKYFVFFGEAHRSFSMSSHSGPGTCWLPLCLFTQCAPYDLIQGKPPRKANKNTSVSSVSLGYSVLVS